MSSITSAEDVYEDASDNPHYLARIKLEVPSPKANVATVRDFIATYLVQQCDFQPAEAIQKASQFTMNGSQLFNQKLAVFEQVLPQNGKGIYMEVQSSYWGAYSHVFPYCSVVCLFCASITAIILYFLDRSITDDKGKVVASRIPGPAGPVAAAGICYLCFLFLETICGLKCIVESPKVPEALKYRPWAGVHQFIIIPSFKDLAG